MSLRNKPHPYLRCCVSTLSTNLPSHDRQVYIGRGGIDPVTHEFLMTQCQKRQKQKSSCEKRESVVKRGRKPGRKANTTKTDMRVKLERSRQSARECRARKKLRYQYLEEQVSHREKAVFMLHKELEQYRQWAKEFDEGNLPEGLLKFVEEQKRKYNGEDDLRNNQSE